MVDLIKEREINDLYLLGAKARNRLHELVDEGKTKTIETVALMDRSFQQRRLLEGKSTENMAHIHADIAALRKLDEQKNKEDEQTLFINSEIKT